MTQIRVKEDPSYGITHKTGTLQLEHGVSGPELEKELRDATEAFIKHMELRGLTLYKPPGGRLRLQDGSMVSNPMWIEAPDGEKAAFYALDWMGERKKDKNGLRDREESLEASEGMVEYRIIGIFWAPDYAIDVLTSIQERKDKERAAKNPTVFGPAGQPQTGG